MDLSKLSDADLQALAKGDVSKLSDEGLYVLAGKEMPKPETSATKAFGKSFMEQAAPTLAGIAAGGRAAAALPIPHPVAKIGAAVIGGIGGGFAASGAQDWLTDKIPQDIKSAFGFSPEQRAAEQQQHPIASAIGEAAPALAAFRPGAVSKLERFGGAALGGAVDAGTQLVQGDIDPTRMGVNAAVNLLAPKATKFGERIMGTSSITGTKPTQDQTGTYSDAVPEQPPAPIDAAKQQQLQNYQRIESELEAKLANAKRFNDPEQVARIEEELATIKYHVENLGEQTGVIAKQDVVDEPPPNLPDEAYRDLEEQMAKPSVDNLPVEMPLGRTETLLESNQSELPIPEALPLELNPVQRDVTQQAKTVDERHAEFSSKDLTVQDVQSLQRDLDGKIQRLEQWEGSPHTKSIIESEIKAIEFELNRRATDAVRRADSASSLAPELTTHVRNGDVKSALEVVASKSPMQTLRVIANALLGNPNVISKGKIGFDFNQKHSAQHNAKTNDVTFKSETDVGPVAMIHEVLHRATANIIDKVKAGLIKNKVQVAAVKNISNLYDQLRFGEHKIALIKAYEGLGGKASDLDIMLKNEKELVSYGTTDAVLAQALQKVKINGQPTWKKLAKQIADMFGFDTKTRNAYQELMENTLKIVETSTVPSAKTSTINPIAIKLDTKNIKESLSSLGVKSQLRLFTDQAPQLFKDIPALQELARAATDMEHNKTGFINNVLYGKADPTAPISLKMKEQQGSLVSITKEMKPLEIHGVVEVMGDLYRNFRQFEGESKKQARARFDADAQQAKQSLSPQQQKLFDAQYKAASDLYKYVSNMFQSMGIDYHVPHNIGYFLINRSGKHGVIVSTKGTPIHFERFISEKDAHDFIKKVKEQDPTIEVEIAKQDNSEELFGSLQETLDYMMVRAQATGEGAMDLLASVRNELTGTTKAIGGHLKHRTGLTGYAGTEWFMSKEKQAERYVDSMQNSIVEYVEQTRRRALTLKAAEILQKYGDKMTHEQREIFNTYMQAMVNSRADISKIEKIDNAIRETFQKPFSAIGNKHDQPFADAALQKMNAFTYFTKLGLVPQQWLAQFLSFTAGARDLFNQRIMWNGVEIKENNNPLKAMASAGQGVIDYGKLITKNYDSMDKDLLEAVRWGATQTEVFRPHIAESVLSNANLSQSGKTFNKVFEFLNSGNAFADSHSRVLAFMTYYNHFKDSGLSPKDLRQLAAHLTDSNLMLMGERHQPLIYGDLGLLGKAISPLKTYAHGYAGNVIADVKNAKDLNGMLRLAATSLSAIMMGGVISAPILADYDWIMEKLGMPQAKVSKLAMENLPNFATYGLLSDMSGLDLGSSLRYRSVFDLLSGDMAGLSVAGQAIGGAYTIGKRALTDDVSDADFRQATSQVVPRGLPMAMADELMFDASQRDTIKKTGTEQAISDFGTKDRIATAMGGKSLEEAHIRYADRQRKLENMDETSRKQKAIELILSKNEAEQDKGYDILADLGLSYKEAQDLIKGAKKRQEVPEYERQVYGNTKSARKQYEKFGDMYDNR